MSKVGCSISYNTDAALFDVEFEKKERGIEMEKVIDFLRMPSCAATWKARRGCAKDRTHLGLQIPGLSPKMHSA